MTRSGLLLSALLLSSAAAVCAAEHDVAATRRPMAWGKWTQSFAVRARSLEDWELYRAPSGPGHTCWTSLWHVPNSRDIMLSFDQITGPVEAPPLDAAGRRIFYERFGRKTGQWFIDNGYVANGRNIEILTFRSSDLGRSWQRVGSYPYPGVIGVLDDPQTVMLPGGTLVRTRYGHLIGAPGVPPDAALVQRSIDGGKTWTDPAPMTDSKRYWAIPIRPYLLRDGRVATVISFYRKTRPEETARRPSWNSNGVILSSDAGETWSQDPIEIFSNEGGFRSGDEAAMAELPGGDLFFLHRVYGSQLRDDPERGGSSYQANRRQSIAWKHGSTFRPGRLEDTPIPHGAKPDIIYLDEDLILYTGIGGFWWTGDRGRNWEHLELPPGARTPALYQPECLQVADGSIFCAYHVGGDDAYGKVKQSIRGARLRIEKTSRVAQESSADGESFALYGFPEDSETAVEASLRPPASGAVGLMVSATPGGSGNPATVSGYLLRIADRKASLLRRQAGRKETELASAPLPAGLVRIRLETDGDFVAATADGKRLFRVADTAFPFGCVVLYTENTRAEFVNPRIRGGKF